MPPQRRANCQICHEKVSKYVCSTCEVLYCSVPCYKQHKSHSCGVGATTRKTANTSACTDVRKRDGISGTSNSPSPSPSISALPFARETIDGKEGAIAIQGQGGDTSTCMVDVNERQPSLSSSSAEETELRSQFGRGGGSISASHVRQGQVEEKNGSAGLECSSKSDGGSGEMRTVEDESITFDAPQSQMQSQSQSHSHSRTLTETRAPSPSLLEPLPNPRPLRSLTTLKWPYVPDMPSYPDPLTRDDPKPLTLPRYEAIARSPSIRSLLSSDSNSRLESGNGERLRELLKEIDTLRGEPRERTIERVLGVAPEQSGVFSLSGVPSSSSSSSSPSTLNLSTRSSARIGEGGLVIDGDDMRVLRKLAEAVEVAVRSVDHPNARFGTDPLGLDWESMEG